MGLLANYPKNNSGPILTIAAMILLPHQTVNFTLETIASNHKPNGNCPLHYNQAELDTLAWTPNILVCQLTTCFTTWKLLEELNSPYCFQDKGTEITFYGGKWDCPSTTSTTKVRFAKPPKLNGTDEFKCFSFCTACRRYHNAP